MIVIESNGHRATILKVSSYDEDVTQHWYLIKELNQVRQARKLAIKVAHKYLATLEPTDEYLAMMKKQVKDQSKKDRKKMHKKAKKRYAKKREVKSFIKGRKYWLFPPKGEDGWILGVHVKAIDKKQLIDPKTKKVYKNIKAVQIPQIKTK